MIKLSPQRACVYDLKLFGVSTIETPLGMLARENVV